MERHFFDELIINYAAVAFPGFSLIHTCENESEKRFFEQFSLNPLKQQRKRQFVSSSFLHEIQA